MRDPSLCVLCGGCVGCVVVCCGVRYGCQVAGLVVDSPVVAHAAGVGVSAKPSPKTKKRGHDNSSEGNKHANPRGFIAQQPTRLPSPSHPTKRAKRITGSPQAA